MSVGSVLELRQYTLLPGRREELISLFERELLDPQEAVGMDVLGMFRDIDEPNRFVWLRGFPDLESRRQSLSAFYNGPVWRAHRQAANATMTDSDDVLLLRPARPELSELEVQAIRDSECQGIVLAAIASVETTAEEHARLVRFETIGVPALASAGLTALGYYVTEPAENMFPALPVREGERVFVCLAGMPDARAAGDPHRLAALIDSVGEGAVVTRRLEPTPRSPLHGGSLPCAVAR